MTKDGSVCVACTEQHSNRTQSLQLSKHSSYTIRVLGVERSLHLASVGNGKRHEHGHGNNRHRTENAVDRHGFEGFLQVPIVYHDCQVARATIVACIAFIWQQFVDRRFKHARGSKSSIGVYVSQMMIQSLQYTCHCSMDLINSH